MLIKSKILPFQPAAVTVLMLVLYANICAQSIPQRVTNISPGFGPAEVGSPMLLNNKLYFFGSTAGNIRDVHSYDFSTIALIISQNLFVTMATATDGT